MKKNVKKILFTNLVLSLCITPYFHTMKIEKDNLKNQPIYEILAKQEFNILLDAEACLLLDEEVCLLNKKTDQFDNKDSIKIPDYSEYSKKDYERLLTQYKSYENKLQYIQKEPKISIFGHINYNMSLDQMKEKTNEIFQKFKQDGLIISKSEFEKVKNDYFYKQYSDLTRIWGIEYLKDSINKSKFLSDRYATPDYIIVADNPEEITVELNFFNNKFAIVSTLKDAKFYLKNIKGSKAAYDYHEYIGISSGIGFSDFSDPGNIIMDEETGKYYIVDTEFKSFTIELDHKLKELLNYAKERFSYLNKDALKYSSYEHKINLSK
ncbi:MAG: hypothetical protein M0R03_13365 [Novosphingobium sp.]|nr:hypothetical protein [Novosphingobium sp.]